MLKSVGRVACMGQVKVHIKYYSEKLNEKRHLEDLSVDEKAIKITLNK
jgi:hypothetical protein